MTEEKAKYAVSTLDEIVKFADFLKIAGAAEELAAYKNLAEWVRKFKKMGYLVNDELFGALEELDKVLK